MKQNDYIVLDCNNNLWDETLNRFPNANRDIYYTSWYYQLEEIAGHGEANVFVYTESDKIAFYPFLLNKVPSIYDLGGTFYDIETAYGYGGPIVNTDDTGFINDFEKCFLQYCKYNHIIAEFVRFHPLLKNEKIFNRNIAVDHNRTTVWMDLEKGEDNLWMEDVSSRYRNKIRGCIKNGLTIHVSKEYKNFMKLYYETMERDKADPFYYFDDAYFEKLVNHENTVLMYVRDASNQIIAGVIFFHSEDYFHYHLGASSSEYLCLRPNNFVLWEGCKIGIERGCRKYHLGGGLSDDLTDTLFQFKKGFSKSHADFYIGRRVHNKDVYDGIMNKWEKTHNVKHSKLLEYKNI